MAGKADHRHPKVREENLAEPLSRNPILVTAHGVVDYDVAAPSLRRLIGPGDQLDVADEQTELSRGSWNASWTQRL